MADDAERGEDKEGAEELYDKDHSACELEHRHRKVEKVPCDLQKSGTSREHASSWCAVLTRAGMLSAVRDEGEVS